MQSNPPPSNLTRKQEAQFRVMQAIVNNPNITQRELASQMGVSLGRAHYCLASLLEVGWVKMSRFRGSSEKKQYAYILTPSGISQKAEITGRFLKRKIDEYQALKREIEVLREEIGVDVDWNATNGVSPAISATYTANLKQGAGNPLLVDLSVL